MERNEPSVCFVQLSLILHWFATALVLTVTSSCEHSIQAAPTESESRGVTADSRTALAPRSGPSSSSSNVASNHANEAGLRLASWNLEWLSASDLHGPVPRTSSDYARLARYATLLDADIVAVQEVESVAALSRVFDSQRYNFHVTADGRRQNTGFVYSKQLNVEILPDYTALGAFGLRSGADIRVRVGEHTLRLLSVHLKSGCFDAPLTRNANCVAFGAQVPKLEQWIDERAREALPFAVLGDFNRRFFGRAHDEVWLDLDDANPAESDLESPTRNARSTCWSAEHPQFIDHLLLSRTLSAWVEPRSFWQQTYDVNDAPYRKQLSDHCPIAVTVRLGAAPTSPPAVASADSIPHPRSPIKGNISRSGKHLYHTVDCPNYDRVKIDAAKGERWFDSEYEAQAAGFERARECRK